MSDLVLIKLYLDAYGGLKDIDDQTLVVADLPSYAAARRAIEALKAGERAAPLTVIVRSRHFFGGFHDLPLLGKWVQVTRIAPRDEIARAFHLQLPSDLTDPDLIAVGIQGPGDLLAAAGPYGIHDQNSLEDALLAKAFGTRVLQSSDCDFGGWFKELIVFLHSGEASTGVAWRVKAVRHLAEEKIRAALERFARVDLLPFAMGLVERSVSGTAPDYLDQLALRYWLRDYGRLARRTVIDNLTDVVGHWQEVQAEATVMDALAPWCETLYGQSGNPLCERVEEVLALLLEQGDLIEEQDPSRFMQQTSGLFAAEYDATQARFGKLLMTAAKGGITKEQRAAFSTYSAQLNAHFAPLFSRTGRPVDKAPWIDSLVEFSDMVHHLDEAVPTRWADWLATCELLIKARRLNTVLQDALPNPYREQMADLSALFSILDERLNSAFADWLLKVYPALIASRVDQPPLAMNGARLALEGVARGARVILLVLDGLDWELWQHLRSVLGKEGFAVQDHEAGLAMVPPITEFSRRAIFAGLSPRNLANFVDDIYGTDIPPQEEAKALARALGYLGRVGQLKPLAANQRIQYLGGELVYVNGSLKEFRQALELEARCYALVYAEIDSLIHDSKLEESKLKATVRQWLTDLVGGIAQSIRQNRALREETHLQIIVASDHGFLDVSGQSQAGFDPSLRTFLDLERHGRLAIVRVKTREAGEGMLPALQAAKDFCRQHPSEWHAVWREQGAMYGLAESSPSEGEVVAWLMPRPFRYINKGRGNYVHGGLSMYEMIVPLAVLARGEPGIEVPVVTLTGRLATDEEGTLSIAILNKNDRPLQNLVVDIPELGVASLQAKDVGPAQVEKLEVPVVPTRSGDIPVRVILNGEIGGAPKRFEEMRVLAVQPGRRERMRLSTRRTFDDEDER